MTDEADRLATLGRLFAAVMTCFAPGAVFEAAAGPTRRGAALPATTP